MINNSPTPQTQPKPFTTPTKTPKTTSTSNFTTTITSFDELNLKPTLTKGLLSIGYTTPTEIQSKAILPLLNGKDTIAQGQSGTGKTGAFLISAL